MRNGGIGIRARDLRKTRRSGDTEFVLEVPCFEVRAGERVALIGQSGSGKSTLIGLLALALPPDPGGTLAVTLDDPPVTVDVAGMWRDRRDADLARLRRRIFGQVQQRDGLLPFLTIEENILLPTALSGRRDRAAARELAERLGIGHLLRRRPDRISVGQRQRAAVARAVLGRPGILLADEPTAALDHDNGREVLRLLVERARADGAALVLATHNTALADDFDFERVEARVMSGGRTVFEREAGRA